MPRLSLIQPRRGTAAEWTAANPILAAGEMGYETDTNQSKRGDGVTAWTALPYVGKWDTIPGKPAVVAAGETQADARTAIGAVAKGELVVNVKDHGAVGNGVGDDVAAINAAINAAQAAGGGVAFLPAGTYLITTPLVLPSKVRLIGAGSSATIIKLANGANSNVIESDSVAMLVNSNKWLVSEGVPVAFSVEHLRVDGNKANNTSGHGIRFYGKRFNMIDLIVHETAEHGIYTDCAYKGGQENVNDLPEGEYDQIFVWGCGGDGILYRGPHDAHWGTVYTAINGGRGFATEVANSGGLFYNGQCDIDFIHSYANTGDGVQLLSGGGVNHLQVESNYSRGLLINNDNVRIGTLYAYKNWRTFQGVGAGNNASVEVTAGPTTIAAARIRADNAGTALRIATNTGTVIGALSIDGMSNTFGGIGLDLAGNNIDFGSAYVAGFSGVGGVGLQVADDLSQLRGQVITGDCATHIKHIGVAGSRHDLRASAFVSSGQVGVETNGVIGALPPASVGRVDYQLGGVGDGLNSQHLRVSEIRDVNGNIAIATPATPGAVNYLSFNNKAAGSHPALVAAGSDANINFTLTPKGNGDVTIFVGSGMTPRIRASGADASHNLNLVSKGAGVVQANGVPVATRLSNAAALDFGSVATQSFADLTVTVTGAVAGDSVALGVPVEAVTAGIMYSAWVSAADTVTVRAHNYTAGALDPASGTFKATIVR